MSTIAFDFPSILTNKDWQKNKGLLAKAKPTGIGEKLTELEKVFDSTMFGRIDADAMATETIDPLAFGQRKGALLRTLGAQGAKLDAAAAKVDSQVDDALPMFSKDRSVTKYLQTMSLALKGFRAEVRADGGHSKAVAAALDKAFGAHIAKDAHVRTIISSSQSLEQALRDTIAGIGQVKAARTIASVKANFGNGTQRVRTLTTLLQVWDQIVAGRLPELAKSKYSGSAKAQILTLPWMAAFGNEPAGGAATASHEMEKRVADGQSEPDVVLRAIAEFAQSMMKMQPLMRAYKEVAEELRAAM